MSYSIQYQVSLPLLNPADGFYYQRMRMITDDGRVLDENIYKSAEQGSDAGLFGPIDGDILYVLDFMAGLLQSASSVALGDPRDFATGLLDLTRLIAETPSAPYSSWPGTDAPWDPSTLNSDPSPHWDPGLFQKILDDFNPLAPFLPKHPSVPNPHDPLVLDLAGSGIALTPLANSSAYFDFTGSGFATQTGWISSGEGLLVRDNGDSNIAVEELLGGQSGDGFADLASLDSNADNRLDASDSAFASLKVWVDSNSNGRLDAGELHSLGDIGITSINLATTVSDRQVNGNTIVSSGTFMMSGVEHDIAEVDLATSPVQTRYSPPADFVYDTGAFTLPQLVGYGNVPNLWIAMSLNAALLSGVQNLVANASSMSGAAFDESFEALLQEWVGASEIDPSSRGAYVDARHLAVVYAFYGIDQTEQPAYAYDPNQFTGAKYEAIYQSIVAELEVRFTSQVVLSAGLNGADWADVNSSWLAPFTAIVFDSSSDTISVDFDQLMLRIVQSAPTDPDSAANYFEQTGRILKDLNVDLFNEDTPALAAAVLSKFGALGVSVDLQKTAIGTFGFSEIIDETSTTGAITLSTSNGLVFIGGGDKTISGGTDNVYVYSPDAGNVSIQDAGSHAQVALSGTSSAGAVLERPNGGDDLVVVNSETNAALVVSGYFAIGGFGTIAFGDVALSVDAVKQALHDEAVTYLKSSAAADDTVAQTDAELALFGYVSVVDEGASTGTVHGTSGTDVILIGAGDKTVAGDGGSDIYAYASAGGNVVIDDSGNNGNPVSTLAFNGVNSSDVTISRPNGGSDLLITDTLTGKTVTITSEFAHSGPIQTVTFSDGVSWTYDQIKQMLLNEQSAANGGAIYGYGGNGFGGSSETLIAGLGDKYMNGEGGEDTYVYSSAGGNDVVADGQNLVSHLEFTDIASTDVTLSRIDGGSDLIINVTSTGKTVTIDREFANGGPLATIAFSDGVSWTYDQIKQMLLDEQSAANGGAIYGYGGNGFGGSSETLIAGLGDKYMNGEGGDDTYVYSSTGGNDIVDDEQNFASTLQFTDVASTDVTLSRPDGGTELVITNTTTGKTVTIHREFANGGPLAAITFSDGISWTYDQVKQMLLDQETAANGGSVYGYSSNDTIVAGLGDKYLSGDGGTDTYVYSSAGGDDVVDDEQNLLSTLQFTDIASTDVALSRPDGGTELVITNTVTGKTVTVHREFANGGPLAAITFSDGVSWTYDQVKQMLLDQESAANGGSVYGYSSNDTIVAGLGDKYLNGGGGTDTYIYSSAGGNDVVDDEQNLASTLQFTDIASTDVTLSRPDGGTELVITNTTTGKAVTVHREFANGGPLAAITFSDGVSWSYDHIVSLLSDPNNSVISGTSGNDSMTLPADATTIDPGPGDDSLSVSGTGADTIVFAKGDGHDTLDNPGSGYIRTDTLDLTDSVPSDVQLSRSGYDLLVTEISTGDTFDAKWQFDSNNYGLAQIHFSDGTVWDRAQISERAWVLGTSGNDLITLPTDGVIVDPGHGNDTLSVSGNGTDTIVFSQGDDHDTLTNPGSGYVRSDTLSLIDSLPSDVELSRSGDAMSLSILSTGDTFTASYQFWGDGASQGLGFIKFVDGTTWDRADIAENAWTRGTAGNDSITLPTDGATVDGGTGDDTLSVSGNGGDTIVFAQGDGHDTLTNPGAGYNRDDTLVLTDINPWEVQFSRSGDAMTLSVPSTGDSFKVNYQYWGDGSQIQGLTHIQFANGTVWDHAALSDVVSTFTWAGSGSNPALVGNDYGANTFQLGGGAETAIGGLRSNVYQVSSSTGQAEIQLPDSANSRNELDFVGSISDQNLWFEQRGDDLRIDLLGTSTNVTVDNWFGGSAAEMQEITAGGLKIDSQVSQLVQAMATYSANNPAFDPASASGLTVPNDSGLQSAVASSWHA